MTPRPLLPVMLVLVTSACTQLVIDHTQRPGSDGGNPSDGGYSPDPDAGNLLDPNTSNLQGGVGQWVAWYGSTVARVTNTGVNDSASLEITLNASNWGVETNYPGATAAQGTHRVRFWARAATATDLTVGMSLNWLNASQGGLRTDSMTSPTLTPEWQSVEQTFQAPAGTASLEIQLQGSGTTSETLDVDDFFVE